MTRTPTLLLAALLCGCGALTHPAPQQASVQLALNTDRLDRDLSGNLLVRDAGPGQVTVREFSFQAHSGVQSRLVYSGAAGTTVDLCVADAVTGARLAGLRFRLSRDPHLVLLQQDAGSALSLQADVAGEPSPRSSCSSLQ